MLFGFILMEKNTKRSKKAGGEKNITSYLQNRSTSEHNSNRFKKLQCRATTFVF
jgi:hypothetical protein